MFWFSGIIQYGTLANDALLERVRWSLPPAPAESDAALLVTVQGQEWQGQPRAYHAATCYRFWLTPDEATGWMDIQQPVSAITEEESGVLKSWLIARSWEAWARADVSVRALCGDPTPPISLVEAATRAEMTHVGMAKAVERGAIPAIRAADRLLVYAATIDEARARWGFGAGGRRARARKVAQ